MSSETGTGSASKADIVTTSGYTTDSDYPLQKTTKRAERRHHLRRMKAKAKRIAIHQANHDPEYEDEILAGWLHHANHLACCSCSACGNPRRYDGEPTLQERRTAHWRKEMDDDLRPDH